MKIIGVRLSFHALSLSNALAI